MESRLSLAVVAAVSFASSVSAQSAGEWAQFHGPNHDNKSAETGLLKKWPDDGPELLWTASGVGKGYSSVTVANGMIYAAGMLDRQTYVTALDMQGQPSWKALNGASWQAGQRMRYAIRFAGARGTPTVHEGLVYHLAELGRLVALDAKTGTEVWSVDLFEKFDAKCPKYGLCESVRIDGNKLICCPGGTKGYMVALDKKTGETIWSNTEVKGPVGYGSAVIVESGGVRQIISVSAKEVFGLDAGTGRLLWRVAHGNQRNNSATDPIYYDGRVFASSGYGAGSISERLSSLDGSVKAQKAWTTKLMDNHHGGVVLVDGHLYGSGHRAKGWFCLDFLTGEKTFQHAGKGAVPYADGMLYCLEEKGTMSLVKATPEKYAIVSSFQVPRGGEGAYWAHPVVCGGRLYLRHADCLYAYNIKGQ